MSDLNVLNPPEKVLADIKQLQNQGTLMRYIKQNFFGMQEIRKTYFNSNPVYHLRDRLLQYSNNI